METVREFISTVFIVKEGKVLLTWNKKVLNWVPLGGHIEPNELPCASVIREAKEESGLDIELVDTERIRESANLVQPIHIHLDHIRDDHKHINLIYFARAIGGEIFAESDEQTALKWFSAAELADEKMFPNVREWGIEAIQRLK